MTRTLLAKPSCKEVFLKLKTNKDSNGNKDFKENGQNHQRYKDLIVTIPGLPITKVIKILLDFIEFFFLINWRTSFLLTKNTKY